MFEPVAVGVALAPALLHGVPAGPVAGRRIGEVLPVAQRSDEELAVELQRVAMLEAELVAYKAELVVELGWRRPAAHDVPQGRPGAAANESVDEHGLPELVGTSEFLAEELAHTLGCSRRHATTLINQSFTLRCRLPRTWAALADGMLDWPRARGLAAELGSPAAAACDPAVIAAVEAVLLPIAGELSVLRLRELARRELLARDPSVADRRRKVAEKATDVNLRRHPDGMAELSVFASAHRSRALWDTVNTYARMLQADGDPRPVGQLRVQALEDLVLRPWDTSREPVTATLTLFTPLTHLHQRRRPDTASEPGPTAPAAELNGQPITAAHLRALLEQLQAICPGGLQPPAGGTLRIGLTDPDGTLRATIDHTELRRLARRGCPTHPAGDCGCPLLDRPPEIDRYEPTPAQRRFVTTRDRTCRHPGCANRAGWADLDHVIPHAEGGPTACENLCCLCRRHHRLKTHARGWFFTMTDDGVLTVTSPSGVTRVTRPPGQIDHAIATAAAAYDPADDPPPF